LKRIRIYLKTVILLFSGSDGLQKKTDDQDSSSEFEILQRQTALKIQETRKIIQERDDILEASSGSGGRKSIALSAKSRELLRQAKDLHKQMQDHLLNEEIQFNKSKVSTMVIAPSFCPTSYSAGTLTDKKDYAPGGN
jgi:hypothetical protein